MSPKYASQDIIFVKSYIYIYIYSFAVSILEILSGKRNHSFNDIDWPITSIQFVIL